MALRPGDGPHQLSLWTVLLGPDTLSAQPPKKRRPLQRAVRAGPRHSRVLSLLAGGEAAPTWSPRQVDGRRLVTVPGAVSIHRGRASPGSAHLGGPASERKPQFRCCQCPGASAGELGSWRGHRGLFPPLPRRRELRCRTAVWGPLRPHVIRPWDRASHLHKVGQSLTVPCHCPKPSVAPFAPQRKGGSLEALIWGSPTSGPGRSSYLLFRLCTGSIHSTVHCERQLWPRHCSFVFAQVLCPPSLPDTHPVCTSGGLKRPSGPNRAASR